ncbi:MAG TPA: septum formation initiator family protein [Bryobacteraceae bacterium]|jgi:cell division protein FtsB|nr:septum formation initiator family protein [Bryobacteraceae bacterium]
MKVSLVKYGYVIALLMVVSYAYVTLRGPKGVQALFDKQAQIRQMEKRNADLDKEIERKREHIKRLGDNPAEQELEIRGRLKLVHPNEKVFITGPLEKK